MSNRIVAAAIALTMAAVSAAPAQTVEMVATQPETNQLGATPKNPESTVPEDTEAMETMALPHPSQARSFATAAEAAEVSRHLTSAVS